MLSRFHARPEFLYLPSVSAMFKARKIVSLVFVKIAIDDDAQNL